MVSLQPQFASPGIRGSRKLFQRNADGAVIGWGNPDGKALVQVGMSIRQVDAWSVFWVDAYVIYARDTLPPPQGMHYHTYAVDDDTMIRTVFDAYFGNAGVYKRVRFTSEEWIWTEEEGWEPEDHC